MNSAAERRGPVAGACQSVQRFGAFRKGEIVPRSKKPEPAEEVKTMLVEDFPVALRESAKEVAKAHGMTLKEFIVNAVRNECTAYESQ